MAVRTDFAPGEVLTSSDLNDTFASKAPFSYGTAEPSTTVEGFIWFDENDDPATPKYWDGSEFVPFPSGAGDAVISSPSATGNYTDDGIEYDYYTFTASGTLTVDTAGFADVLVVGGGGGGGSRSGGGGGAGGHLYITDAYFDAGSLTVTVGAGGAGVTPAVDIGLSGGNGAASRIANFYAPGGGAGAPLVWVRGSSTVYYSSAGFAGGSGGGAGAFSTGSSGSGGAGITGLGNSGGTGASSTGTGGGGGAGAAGSNATTGAGGAGGAGTANSITGSSVTRAGGGGGTGGSTDGAGGSGGGGAGSKTGTATSGTANTGGGGGGTQDASTTSGNGGSGVVIVRVKV